MRALKGAGVGLILLLVVRVVSGWYVDVEAARFSRRCDRIAVGMSYAEARAAFGSGVDPGSHPGMHAFLFHSGWTGMQCEFEVDGDRVVTRGIRRWHDLDRCTDREAYPRRFWLCWMARPLLP